MALCYPPCLGEARILIRPAASKYPLLSGYTEKLSTSFSFKSSFWAANVRKYHRRRQRRSGASPPFEAHHATHTSSLKAWRLRVVGPTASLAQSSRTSVVTAEAAWSSSDTPLLSFSYAPPASSSSADGPDGDGGGAVKSSSVSVNSRERIRRDRIAQANKGKVPWNKGKQHSPETIAKIKERTKVAMRNPQVREKLRHFGKNQSSETKAKIREKMVGVWQSKKMIKLAQDACIKEWKELVADAARVGGPDDDEEHQWNTYSKIQEQFRRSALDAARREKQAAMERQKADARIRRALGCSDAHRKAISDAIKAKWADPEYRSRVFAGMQSVNPGKRRRPPVQRRTPAAPKGVQRRSPAAPPDAQQSAGGTPPAEKAYHPPAEKKKPTSPPPPVDIDEEFIAEVLAEEITAKTRSERSTAARIKGPQKVMLVRLGDHSPASRDERGVALTEGPPNAQHADVAPPVTGRTPPSAEDAVLGASSSGSEGDKPPSTKAPPPQRSYKDPLVHEKLQKIRQLREGRLEVELKRKEAADRARMLIADAERAASALEQAAKTDKAAMATLIETRRLLAEATRSMQAAEVGWAAQDANAEFTKPKRGASLERLKFSLQHPDGGGSASPSGDDFHSRVWTRGDKMAECPHPIPIRAGNLRAGVRDEYHVNLNDSKANFASGSRSANPASGQPDLRARGEPPASASRPSHAQGDERLPVAADSAKPEKSQESVGDGEGKGSPSKTRAGKKRWHRGRLVAEDEDEST